MSGWTYIGLIDNGSVVMACEFCSTPIRYEHIIESPQGIRKNVGVCCAAEATDGDAPQKAERKSKNLMRCRMNFPNRSWKLSRNGNRWLKAGPGKRYVMKKRGRCWQGLFFDDLYKNIFGDVKETFEQATLNIFDKAVAAGWRP